MPENIKFQLWELIPTAIYFVVSLLLFGFAVWLMTRITPFCIRKEIEEDQNTALAIIIGATLIALAIVISSVIK